MSFYKNIKTDTANKIAKLVDLSTDTYLNLLDEYESDFDTYSDRIYKNVSVSVTGVRTAITTNVSIVGVRTAPVFVIASNSLFHVGWQPGLISRELIGFEGEKEIRSMIEDGIQKALKEKWTDIDVVVKLQSKMRGRSKKVILSLD